ncbi:histidine kinase [Agromyces endophyticus]|uniref:sensor histidine kinase n=1 Tax=Agromyces sp. H17E-10 TaxID=2932244 RepID=UPI001FD0166B|nr:histidine kinase [Agromyces sp. H17E-10]UOQ89143.1 histidine kinase [Agromyces sp. H17E-10]
MVSSSDEMHDPSDPRPRLPVWVGDVIAGALVVAATFAPVPGEPYAMPSLVTLTATGIAALVLPLRRRWPVPVLAACIALYGVVALDGVLSSGVGLAVAIAMFGVTNRSSRRSGLIVMACALAAVVLVSIPATIGSPFEPRVFQVAFLVAAAAAAGDATRSRRQYIRAITERAERAERTREAEAQRRVSEERLKIARDLHDAVAHQIAVISLNAGVASTTIESKPERAKAALSTIRSAARTVLGEIGDLLAVLRTEDDRKTGTAPQPSLARVDELVGQFAAVGLDVNVRIEGDLSRVAGTVDSVGYRVVQEALTNAHKHGAEHRAHVLIRAGERDVELVVTNPMTNRASPQRPSADAESVGAGLGLIGLRERVAAVRGSIEIGAGLGGWRLAARLPFEEEDRP